MSEWTPVVAFTVSGEPIPKGRPRAKAGQRSFTPKRTVEAEKRVQGAFHALHPGFRPLTGRLLLSASFYRATARHVDADNLAKLATDALNGVAYVDDEQIEELHVRRFYGVGDQARTVIRIFERTDALAVPAGATGRE